MQAQTTALTTATRLPSLLLSSPSKRDTARRRSVDVPETGDEESMTEVEAVAMTSETGAPLSRLGSEHEATPVNDATGVEDGGTAPVAGSNAKNIYLATYSHVAVYELMVRGIACMRRRSDGYINATQVLKIAGIDKAKRTKILEKEILTGEHEKVQGGYGKYQGTW